jgi:AcrR family transcriptional regulator
VTETSKGSRTRKTLLELAIRRFAAAGYQSTSLADVCRDAGMSTTAAYAYFPSKADLFAAAVDADADGLIRDALDDVLAGDFSGDWSDMFARLLIGLEHHPLARRVLAGEEGKTADRLLVLPAEAALRQGLGAALRSRQQEGDVRSDIDPDVAAIGLETIVIALLIATLQSGGVADSERAPAVLAVLDASIRTPGAPTTFPAGGRTDRASRE